MVMAKMTPGSCPRVEDFKGDVAMWAGEPSDPIGFVVEPAGAITLAGRLLATVAEIRGDNLPMLEVSSITAEHAVLDDGERAVKIVVNVDGAPLPMWLDLTRFAELTAGCIRLSNEADTPSHR